MRRTRGTSEASRSRSVSASFLSMRAPCPGPVGAAHTGKTVAVTGGEDAGKALPGRAGFDGRSVCGGERVCQTERTVEVGTSAKARSIITA